MSFLTWLLLKLLGGEITQMVDEIIVNKDINDTLDYLGDIENEMRHCQSRSLLRIPEEARRFGELLEGLAAKVKAMKTADLPETHQ